MKPLIGYFLHVSTPDCDPFLLCDVLDFLTQSQAQKTILKLVKVQHVDNNVLFPHYLFTNIQKTYFSRVPPEGVTNIRKSGCGLDF